MAVTFIEIPWKEASCQAETVVLVSGASISLATSMNVRLNVIEIWGKMTLPHAWNDVTDSDVRERMHLTDSEVKYTMGGRQPMA